MAAMATGSSCPPRPLPRPPQVKDLFSQLVMKTGPVLMFWVIKRFLCGQFTDKLAQNGSKRQKKKWADLHGLLETARTRNFLIVIKYRVQGCD